MTIGTAQIERQRGVILLAFFAVLFIAGAGVLISVLDSNAIEQRRSINTVGALREAKESLLTYATLYPQYYSAANSGPGYLPCPDSNGDGVEDAPCAAANLLGRLPQSIVLPAPNSSIFWLSNHNADRDEQFWYSVANNFKRDPAGVLNSSTISGTTLDGQGRIAAVILAPGLANSSQARPSNTASRYLEDSNSTAPSFVSSTAVNPDLFNDQVIAITIDEIMRPVTRQVATLLKAELDAFHVLNTRYPLDQAEFDISIAPMTQWFVDNDWQTNSNYAQVDDDSATLTFTGCINMSYTVDYDPINATSELIRTGLRC